MIVKVLRFILVLPGALLAYMLASLVCTVFREGVVTEDSGLIAYYSTLFVANIVSCIVCGAVFSAVGVWISPKKNFSVAFILACLASVIFLWYAYISISSCESVWMKICIAVWNFTGVIGALYGGCYVITENKRMENEKMQEMADKYNKTLNELEDLIEERKKTRSLLERSRRYKEKIKKQNDMERCRLL